VVLDFSRASEKPQASNGPELQVTVLRPPIDSTRFAGQKLFFAFLSLVVLVQPLAAQRRPVLPQIDLPHPYYFREMYLPQLTSGPSSVAWSPDSKVVVYSMAGSLWRQEIARGLAVQLTDGPGYDYQPDWSPDGKSVVYVSYQKDAMELWLLDLGSGQTRQLTHEGAVNVEPRWSPDGKRIIFVSTAYNKRFHIFRADVNGGGLQNVVRLTGETKSELPRYYYSAVDTEINPVWARDGKEILFISNRGHIHGTGGFWRMKAEPGAEAREIHYEETNWKARPDFSPDGSRMVYSSYLGREWHQLWVMPAKGGDAFPVSYGDGDETNVRWSPDGKQMAFISNRTGNTDLWLKSIPGSGQRRLEITERKSQRPVTRVHVRLLAGENKVSAARVSITDAAGRFYAPTSAWVHADDGFDRKERAFEAHYFHTRGEEELELPAGEYEIEVLRGFEEFLQRWPLHVEAGKEVREDLKIATPQRWTGLSSENWVGSDLHVHMNYGGTYRNTPENLLQQAAAENLDIVNNLIVNKEQRFPDIAYGERGVDPASKPERLVVHGQEFHTSYWGHRGLLNLSDGVILPGYAGYPNTAAASLYPMNADVYDMAHAAGAVVGAVHPFDEAPNPFAKPAQRITDELPLDVALGKLDYMEILGFSDHLSTASVWYRLLNLGFRLPAGAGTDATADYAAPIRGQVGMNRVYARVANGPLKIEPFLDALKSGKTFATNGPLLDFSLGGQEIGGELKFDAAQVTVPFSVRMKSIVPMDHLEIVCNGAVVKSLEDKDAGASRDAVEASGTIPLKDSGWCVLRASSDKAEYPVLDNYVYATTSPIYVTIDGKKPRSSEDAKYFAAWIERMIEITGKYPDWNSVAEKDYVMGRLEEGKRVFDGMR
jgi:TolB protein